MSSLLSLPWYWLPKIELVKFRHIDFFPLQPDLAHLSSICIGSKTRTIGDALLLSALPRKLKEKYPALRITTYPRGFNPVVAYANPHVDGVQYLPPSLYGDDANLGSGHLMQLKEQFFGLPVSESPKPEIYLTPSEEAWGRSYVAKSDSAATQGKPICIIHPWGHTWKSVMTPDLWEEVVSRWSSKVSFWQVGVQGHRAIAGCTHHFLTPRAFRVARKLFAVVRQAKLFVGVNSGPMHVAKAFNVPSLILTEQGSIERIFENRMRGPYFLYRNWANGFLYEDNEHLDIPSLSREEVMRNCDRFFEASTSRR